MLEFICSCITYIFHRILACNLVILDDSRCLQVHTYKYGLLLRVVSFILFSKETWRRSFICQFSFFYALLKGYTPEGIYKHSICLIPQLLVGLLHRNLSFWCLQTSLWRGEILLSFRSYFMNDMISCMLLQFLLLQEFTNSQISLKICLHRTDSGLLPSAATRKEIISVSAAIEWGASLRSITGEDARQKNRISTFFPVVTRESGFGLGFFPQDLKVLEQ